MQGFAVVAAPHATQASDFSANLPTGVEFGMFVRPWFSVFLGGALICCGDQVGSAQTLATGGGVPSIYEQPKLLTASIYTHNSEAPRLLFKFRRTALREGSTVHVLREYFYPDGRPAARETVVYEGDSLKRYELQELQTGSSGTVTLSNRPGDPGRRQVSFEYNKDLAHKTHTHLATESVNFEPLVNDMIGVFVSTNFERLAKGLKVGFRYIVVSRKEIVGLSFTEQGQTTYHGRKAIVLKLQPTNPFLAVLVDPLYFTVEAAPPHRVLQYVGRTTPKINEGGRWKDLDAVTIFDW